MAVYIDEAQVWKCIKHPSRRRRNGICAKCLRERLVTLCPDCAGALPCAGCPTPVADSSESSSTSSSSFSLFSFSRGGSRRVSNNLEAPDPMLRKSRSVAVSLFRSRSRYVGNGDLNGICNVEGNANNCNGTDTLPKVSRSKINFWSVFTVNKSKKCDVHVNGTTDEELNNKMNDHQDQELSCDNSMMMRSRSVAVGTGSGLSAANSKHKGWYFPSPIKAFRHPKPPRSVAVA